MKSLVIALMAACLFFFSSCKNDPPNDASILEQQLAGLHLLTLEKTRADSIWRFIRDSLNVPFPVYSETGERLTQAEIRKRKINMHVDAYADSLANIRAVVFRKATSAEIEEHLAAANRLHEARERWIHSWVGKQAPAITARDIQGNMVDLSKLAGKTVVLNFWFTRCHACVQEMPELNQLVEEFGKRNVVFLAITFDPKDETRRFLEKTPFDYQVIADGQFLFNQFGIGPCPVDIVINPDGNITFAEVGYEAAGRVTYETLRKAIRQSVLGKSKP